MAIPKKVAVGKPIQKSDIEKNIEESMRQQTEENKEAEIAPPEPRKPLRKPVKPSSIRKKVIEQDTDRNMKVLAEEDHEAGYDDDVADPPESENLDQEPSEAPTEVIAESEYDEEADEPNEEDSPPIDENPRETGDDSNPEKIKATRLAKLLAEVNPVESVASSRTNTGSGAMSIIRSAGNGKRITFPLSVLEKLGSPETLQVGFDSSGIMLSEKHPRLKGKFVIKQQGARGIIYSAPLVEELIRHFQLEFHEKVSMTFVDIEYYDDGEHPLAYISMIS